MNAIRVLKVAKVNGFAAIGEGMYVQTQAHLIAGQDKTDPENIDFTTNDFWVTVDGQQPVGLASAAQLDDLLLALAW